MNIFRRFDYEDKSIEFDFLEINRRKKNLKLAVSLAVVTLVISAFAVISPDWNKLFLDSGIASIYTQSTYYPMSIFILNSGNANCVLIHSDEANILVDCGQEKENMNVLNTLNILGIDNIDLVILTHPDKDHIGNMEQVIESVDVKRFVTCKNGDYDLTEIYKSLTEALDNKNINIETAKSGDKITFGELTLDIVSPIMVYDTSNNNSVVVKLCYGAFTALLTGDIGKKAEKDILNSGADISASVLLVPHHGSGSSTTEEFLEAVNPKYAILSVEENDNLPNNQTVAKLIKHGCELYRTDFSGNIAVVSDGVECRILTEYNSRSTA